jgi:pullulanase/glycogen debranching enzyme
MTFTMLALTGCSAGDAPTQLQLRAESTAVTLAAAAVTPAPAAATIRMHYHRVQNDTSQWGVYSWDGPVNPSSAWITDRFMMTSTDDFGGYVDIPINTAKSAISFLVTDGNGNKNCGNDQSVNFAPNIATAGQQIWMLEGDCTVYASQPAISYGNLTKANAHWLSANTLAWPAASTTGSYRLYYSANGGLGSDASGITGADGSVSLAITGALPQPLRDKFPHLSNATALTLSDADAAAMPARVSGQFAIAQFDAGGKMVQVTSLQTNGMLDAVFAQGALNTALGATFDAAGVPTFRVWAPTAKSVALNIYPDATAAATRQVPMTRNAAGVWSYTAPDAAWTNKAYYTYNVRVLSRWANNTIVDNVVTDPYSLSVAANSVRSFVANLDSDAMKPAGWDAQTIPRLDHPTDIALYELHIRDFSASDSTVPATHRGKYLAFTDLNSNGMRHLKDLQRAGMSHIHLLPAFDFASVSETGCKNAVVPAGAPDGTTQQAAVAPTVGTDCFNWGYDPVHYNAPEGSYATNTLDAGVRVREFRAMVASLHNQGLRVAMDVVYNHTSASMQGSLSVLDKIVPAYYYRLGADGSILADSCCADTAAENAMMGKLMIDSVASWATRYKIDSFRFDIMGFAPLAVLTQLQATVNQAAGRDIYLYGEGWNFGAAANDARFVQARQANLYGTGIGSFNDRMRDTIHGGGCCDTGDNLISQQGFINGAYVDPNALANQSKDDLLRLGDLVKVALSGTVRDYSFTDRFGSTRTNTQIDYFGQQAGYTANPGETINYVEAHDNQTLFDLNAYKLPQSTPIADRVRVQNLGAAINLLSQGVPFMHAGQEILRSKSMDRDSYNAGDYFNKLDFSYASNNFGIGLPLAANNQETWQYAAPVLRNPLIKPAMADIVRSKNYVTDMLAIRKDSALFRMRTAGDISERLRFHNTGPSQVGGLIVMSIDGASPRPYDGANHKAVVVLFNVDKVAATVTVPELAGRTLAVHKVQQASVADTLARTSTYNSANGTFTVPARTTVVFVQD